MSAINLTNFTKGFLSNDECNGLSFTKRDWASWVTSFLRDQLLGRLALGMVVCLASICLASMGTVADACPFCSALAPTLSDDLEEGEVAVIACSVSDAGASDGSGVYQMRITAVVKGDSVLKDSMIEVTAKNPPAKGELFWLVGYGQERLQWSTAKTISKSAVPYLFSLRALNGSGAERLEHFLGFLQHSDPLVVADAYNEFADASLTDIAALSGKLDRSWVIATLRNPAVNRHRRRLCWTFLSQCGLPSDAGLFHEVNSESKADPNFELGLDAAISCFITLGGEPALVRVERDYLANPDADYLDSFAAINAIRVQGTELKIIPRERLAQSFRQVLSRPSLADLVIPDLARWEDWGAMDRIVDLFESSSQEHRLVRQAIVLYLKNCPLPAAAKTLERLRTVDGDAVKSAESSMMLYPGLATVPVPPPMDESGASDKEAAGVPRITELPSLEAGKVGAK